MADRTPAPDTQEFRATVISCESRNPASSAATGLLLSQEIMNSGEEDNG
ncbi:MAG: hypothetical protein WBA51_02740 [Erythrobacter sp.]